jgi:hypothetical protein
MSNSRVIAPNLNPYYEFRDALVDAVYRDLVGPYEELEIIKDAPLTKYIAGIVYPRSEETIGPEENNDLPEDDADDFAPDPPVALANLRYPSSFGVTFAVDIQATKAVAVEVTAARYELVPSGEEQLGGALQSVWKRIPLQLQPQLLPVEKSTSGKTIGLAPGLGLFYRVRTAEHDIASMTVVVVNENRVTSGDKMGTRDALSFFQIGLGVTGARSIRAPFVERHTSTLSVEDADLDSYRLLYRDARNFAVGHGCGVQWTLSEDGSRSVEIRSATMPRYELRLADSNPDIPVAGLSMRSLGSSDWDVARSALYALCNGYEEWITSQEKRGGELRSDLKSTAELHMKGCREAVMRMRAGIELVDTDAECRRAFQLANIAMLKQRARTDWLKLGKPTPAPVESDTLTWRPFQIAFILLCLKGIADPGSNDRQIADLLWFPTGGGKTEAYLGLIAFVIFLRRLRSKGKASGVTVLMRYTLRLLTIQQFERAALLICACEYMRKDNETNLGRDRISIGLWVGQNATPNTRKECGEALKKLQKGENLTTENPVQLQQCVWCGAVLDHRNYWQTADDRRLVISCRQEGCEFSKGLPAFLVDEDIYAYRPSLIIGTVDKFAALPWKGETAALFNIDSPNIPRPELIIQDELHLISGPLGTLTGLYETAIDALCAYNGKPAKIVASTATIRRAGSQTKALFDREFRQFPPPAIDAGNLYFAREALREEKGTRYYCGLVAPGTSHSTLMIRTYAALLQAAKDLPGSDSVRDTFWTLLGYFNSLRVLGAAKLQVQDDVTDRLNYLGLLHDTEPREIDEVELTSRVPSAEIPLNLKRIERRYPDKKVVSVLLATNMISVGVDVERLGLMVIMGQPQATSEYIQATSRVGRRFPGLVFALYNAGRSRDRSHYENFVSYHSALYRQVESSSVTPFSPRARDRGLHAVLIALARLLRTKFRPNASASDVDQLSQDLADVRQIILSRAKNVLSDDPEEWKNVEVELDELIYRWKQEGTENPYLVFSKFKHPRESLLVEAYEQHPDCAGRFKTLRSLRDVDKNCDLYPVRLR